MTALRLREDEVDVARAEVEAVRKALGGDTRQAAGMRLIRIGRHGRSAPPFGGAGFRCSFSSVTRCC